MAILLGIVLLMELVSRRLGPGKLLAHAVPAGVVWLGELSCVAR